MLSGTAQRISGGSYTIDTDHANLIYQLALLHGLDAAHPLVVDATASRSAGTLQQTITGTDTVTITTTAAPVLSDDLTAWIDALAAIHGLTVPLVNSAGVRTAGSISQTITTVGNVTTVTRI